MQCNLKLGRNAARRRQLLQVICSSFQLRRKSDRSDWPRSVQITRQSTYYPSRVLTRLVALQRGADKDCKLAEGRQTR
jgi:hypothetical protein